MINLIKWLTLPLLSSSLFLHLSSPHCSVKINVVVIRSDIRTPRVHPISLSRILIITFRLKNLGVTFHEILNWSQNFLNRMFLYNPSGNPHSLMLVWFRFECEELWVVFNDGKTRIDTKLRNSDKKSLCSNTWTIFR